MTRSPIARSTTVRPHENPCRAAALALAVPLLLAAAAPAAAQPSYPPEMEGTTAEVYRAVGEVELNMYLCTPEGHVADDQRPAMVFFFGGGWRTGSPQQFLPQCRYLAERGMVGAVADYRVATRHGVTANESVQDAKSAVRWLRANADRLGIDPERIGAGGGSAGGHLAVATAILPDHDPDPDGPSPVPDALVLFNPPTILAPVEGDPEPTEEVRERFEGLAALFGAPLESMSPYHHLREGLPPTMLFHGTADEIVDHGTAQRFCDGLRGHGVRCDLASYQGEGHGFYNFGRGEGEEKNKKYEDTVRLMDGFLYSLEWLDPKPNPDGTPRKRMTWQESLGDALGRTKPPAGALELLGKDAPDLGEAPADAEPGPENATDDSDAATPPNDGQGGGEQPDGDGSE